MVTINLLPWRKNKKRYESNVVKKIILRSSLLSLCMIIGMHLFLSWQLEKSQRLNDQLSDEIAQLFSFQKTKQNVAGAPISQDRLMAFSNYQTSFKKFINALGNKSSYPVCFLEIIREKNRMTFVGNAYSAMDLTEFLKNWKAASLFSEIFLVHIERKENRFIQFRFRAYPMEDDHLQMMLESKNAI